MSDGTNMENLALHAMRNSIYALAETQTILQILVRHKIVTVEEVANTRSIVYKQPKYASLLNQVEDIMQQTIEINKFEDLFRKSLNEGPGSLSPEEQEYLLNKMSRPTEFSEDKHE